MFTDSTLAFMMALILHSCLLHRTSLNCMDESSCGANANLKHQKSGMVTLIPGGWYGHRLLILSLADGTLLTINRRTGSVLWSIREDSLTFLSLVTKNAAVVGDDRAEFVHSTSGELYRIIGSYAKVVSHDKHGRVDFDPDLIFTPSRQEAVTMGVGLFDGELIYHCGPEMCHRNISGHLRSNPRQALIIRRFHQVNAVLNASSGEEFIRFSFGRHDLFLSGPQSGRGNDNDEEASSHLSDGLLYDIGSGVMYGGDPRERGEEIGRGRPPSGKCWEVRLSAPIISCWVFDRGVLSQLQLISLLSKDDVRDYAVWGDSVLGRQSGVKRNRDRAGCQNLMVVNEHNGLQFLQSLYEGPRKPCCPDSRTFRFRSWKGGVIGSTSSSPERGVKSYDTSDQNEELGSGSCPLVFHGEGSGGEGPASRVIKLKVSWRGRSSIKNISDFLMHVKHLEVIRWNEFVLVVPLISLWREIFYSSVVLSAIYMLLTNSYRLFSRRVSLNTDRASGETGCFEEDKHPVVTMVGQFTDSNFSSLSSLVNGNKASFETSPVVSRYKTDFLHIDRIGTGGFGEVYKAKNTVDGCEYAVKRVTLPDCVSARRKVMREVKALAKLEHPGIVRFYNAWIEVAPVDGKDNLTEDTNEAESEHTPNPGGFNLSNFNDVNMSKTRSSRPSSGFVGHTEKDLDEAHVNSNEDVSVVFESDDYDPDLLLWGVVDKIDGSRSRSQSRSRSRSRSKSADRSDEGVDDESSANGQYYQGYTPCLNNTKCNHSCLMHLYIQMELCHKQTLRTWLLKRTSFRSYQEINSIFYQILRAIEFVHSQNLIHRDLKPSNIFFSLSGLVKIGDFGLVTRVASPLTVSDGVTAHHLQQLSYSSFGNFGSFKQTDNYTSMVGTELYMSPEQLGGLPYNHKIDVYSLGLILFELLVPFNTQLERQKTMSMLKTSSSHHHLARPCSGHPSYHFLINWMLNKDSSKRPSAKQIVNSYILAKILSVQCSDSGGVRASAPSVNTSIVRTEEAGGVLSALAEAGQQTGIVN